MATFISRPKVRPCFGYHKICLFIEAYIFPYIQFPWNLVLWGFWGRWLWVYSKFKMTDPIWRTQLPKVTLFSWNSVLEGYWDRWLRIRIKNSEIQYGKSNMTNQNVKSYLIWKKFCGDFWGLPGPPPPPPPPRFTLAILLHKWVQSFPPVLLIVRVTVKQRQTTLI